MNLKKHQYIAKTLLDELHVGKYSDSSPLPSITLLMRRFGVARATAIHAFEDLKKSGLLCGRSGSGMYLTRKGLALRRSIGLIVPGRRYAEIFEPICREVMRLAQKMNFSLILGEIAGDDSADWAKCSYDLAFKFAEGGVSGVIFQPVSLVNNAAKINAAVVSVLDEAGIPVVLLDYDICPFPQRSDYDLVGINNVEAGRRIARHLKEIGVRRMRFLMHENCAYSVYERLAGVRSEFGDGCELFADPSDEKIIRRVMSGRFPPQALVCGSDASTARLLVTLGKIGKNCPEDVKVAGFDDIHLASLVKPRLTTIHYPCEDVARVAVSVLEERIAGSKISAQQHFLVAPLVVRESTVGSRVGKGRSVK